MLVYFERPMLEKVITRLLHEEIGAIHSDNYLSSTIGH